MSKLLEITNLPERIIAIGDIHGCYDELEVLLTHLESKIGLAENDLVIFIGDYIDRGPRSKDVVERLITFQQKFRQAIFLKGNHEDMLLDLLGYGGHLGKAHMMNGGAETFQSYGLGPMMSPLEIAEALPKTHVSFFLNLESYVLAGDYVFAHAGLHPLRDLRSQLDRDLFWIRDEFINNIHRFEKTIVFGHTPHQDIYFQWPYKIGIDTGLVFGNRLTALDVQKGEIFQVARGGTEVATRSVQLPPVA
jgi:serine/threonine protein phosphatase 1